MVTFKIQPHTEIPGTEMIEVRRDGVLIAGIYAGIDGDDAGADLAIFTGRHMRAHATNDINPDPVLDYDRLWVKIS